MWSTYMGHVTTVIGGVNVDLKSAEQGRERVSRRAEGEAEGGARVSRRERVHDADLARRRRTSSRGSDRRRSARGRRPCSTSLLGVPRLDRLAEAEQVDAANAYPLAEFLGDLKTDVLGDARRRRGARCESTHVAARVRRAAGGDHQSASAPPAALDPAAAPPQFDARRRSSQRRTCRAATCRRWRERSCVRFATTRAPRMRRAQERVARAHWQDIADRVDDVSKRSDGRYGDTGEAMSPLHLTEGEGAEVAKLRDDLSSAVGNEYTLGALLGAGRSGAVFHARNAATSRAVALKVAWEDPAARAQLARETSLTSEVAHPHVLEMRKLYLGKRIFAIEMPLALGGTLDDLFQKGSATSFHYVRGILRQVAGALDHAHAHRIVHGSLCPVKILLDENGQCLVSDFGLRLPLQTGPTTPRPSELGAPAYMPLEQRRDRADVDGRIDQYALAVIAYELLRGRRTWQVSAEGVFAVEAIEIMPTRAIAHGVPLSASIAIKRATSREPGQRYASIAEFVQAFSGDASDVPPTPQRAPRRVGAARRRSLLLGSTALLAAIGIAGSRASVRDKVRALWPAGWSLSGDDSGARASRRRPSRTLGRWTRSARRTAAAVTSHGAAVAIPPR